MTCSKQHKAGSLLMGLIVATLVVATLSAAIVKSLRSQAVTTTHAYNVMRARYAAESGYNYFSSLSVSNQWEYAVQGGKTYTLRNNDRFTISASSNVASSATNLLVKITGRRMAENDVLAVRVLNLELTAGNLPPGSQTNGVSTAVYSEDDFDDATGTGSAKWKAETKQGITTFSANNNKKSGDILFDDIYTNFSLSVTAELEKGPGYGIYYLARFDPADADRIDGYRFQYDPNGGNSFRLNAVQNTYGETRIAQVNMTDIFTSDFDIYDTPHDISITVSNNFHTITVDGRTVFAFSIEVDGSTRTVTPDTGQPDDRYPNGSYTVDADKEESGKIGFRVWAPNNNKHTKVEFTDLTVTTGSATTVSEGGTDVVASL